MPTGSPTIKVTAVFTDAVVPYPEEVTQLENQLVIVTDSHYFFSPYTTETQKTVVEHTGNGVESYTKLDPHTARAKSISFGPFTDIPAFSVRSATISFIDHNSFLTAIFH